jgi:hypothetical protein
VNLKDCQRLLEENSKLKGALEEIAQGGHNREQMMKVASHVLGATKQCAVTPPKSAGAGRFQAAMAGMKL